ncbi:hypothetical protein GGR52DRAFT_574572 [Hypoxylon sp. FL1284]|nr:hypothetical protein GGR52DRAFT_574572 [Hypoxylon sp. FL1284]
MSSLFQQAEASSTEKPVMTKYGHAVEDEGSGMNVKPSALSAGKPQAAEKTDQQAKAANMPVPGAQTPTPSMKKVQDGIEHFQP